MNVGEGRISVDEIYIKGTQGPSKSLWITIVFEIKLLPLIRLTETYSSVFTRRGTSMCIEGNLDA